MSRARLLQNLERLAAGMSQLGLRLPRGLGKRVLTGLVGDELSASIDGLCLRGSFEQRHYLWALRDGKQEPFTAELFKAAVRSGMVVCDVGAFLGYYTLLAAQRMGGVGKVYAFEPDPRNLVFLTRNLQDNGFADIASAVPKALSNKAGELAFFLHGGDRSTSSLFTSQAEVTETIVDCVALDEFLREEETVDVIKMDIEGGEVQALEGMERTLARGRALVMFVECNPRALHAAESEAGDLVEWLRAAGFTVATIDEHARRLGPVDSRIETAKYVNLYCCRNS